MTNITSTPASLSVRYFAWMREHTGTGVETVALPDGVTCVGELVPHLIDGAAPAEGRHGVAQLVGFIGGELRGFDRDTHVLLLKKRHARGFSEAASEFSRVTVFGRR